MKKSYLLCLTIIGCTCIAMIRFSSKKTSSITNGNNVIQRSVNPSKVSDLEVKFIIQSLQEADQLWKPVKIRTSNNTFKYRYVPIAGELPLDNLEVEQRIQNFQELFAKERTDLINIFNYLQLIGVQVELTGTSVGIDGIWDPNRKTISLNQSLIRAGTLRFRNVLAHESIHVAQSCSAGSLHYQPRRIGLPLSSSYEIEQSIGHSAYKGNPQESIYLEQEAYSYAGKLGAAFSLLKTYCR